MTQKPPLIRSGIAALVAATALSSTPLMAQTADPATPPADSSSAPSTVAPQANDTLAPAPDSAPASTTPATDAAAAAPEAAAQKAAPVKRTAAARTHAAVAPVSAKAATAPQPVEAAPSEAAASPAAATAAAEPAPAEPVASAEPAVAEAPAAEPKSTSMASTDDLLPIAAGGFGVLALLGAAAGVRRRRRRRAENAESIWADESYDTTDAYEPAPEPAFVAPPVAARQMTQPITASSTTLPNGFDISRFGPHVQAAYRGPTQDNPSLSLRHRLKRAAAMDQIARKAATGNRPAPSPASALNNPTNGSFMIRRATSKAGAPTRTDA